MYFKSQVNSLHLILQFEYAHSSENSQKKQVLIYSNG